MGFKKLTTAGLLATGLMLTPPVYAQETGEVGGTHQSSIADSARVVEGSVLVTPGSASNFTMIVKGHDSERRIDPKESTISFEANVKGYSADIHGRDVTLKVDKNVKPNDLDKTAKITYTFEDGSTEETSLHIYVVDDKDGVSFHAVDNFETTPTIDSRTTSDQVSSARSTPHTPRPTSDQVSNARPTPHTPVNSAGKDKPQPESPSKEPELLNKTLWTMMSAGETKTVPLLSDPDNASKVKIAVDKGSVPSGWKVDISPEGVLSVTPDRNERLRKVILNFEATHLDGQKDSAQVEVDVIPVTSEGLEKTAQRFEEMERTGELEEYLENNPKIKEAWEEVEAGTPESSTNSSRNMLASTGASVSALGLLGLLIVVAGTFPLLRKRR